MANPPQLRSARDWSWLLLLLSAVLMFLGFAGFGYWPLGFFALVPALWVADPLRKNAPTWTGTQFFLRAWLFGYVAEFGGFYWLVNTLMDFSGFHAAVCVLFASVFYLYQGLQFVFVLASFRALRRIGWSALPATVIPYLASEFAFPMLFEHYYGNTFHSVPILAQVAELGGPLLATALAASSNGALYELFFGWQQQRRVGKPARMNLAVAAAYIVFALVFGYWRIQNETARIANAAKIRVGIVQANMSFSEKWQDPELGRQRHITLSETLENRPAHERPQLLVWPESALAYAVPSDMHSARNLLGGQLETPVLFGALRQGEPLLQSSSTLEPLRIPLFNTAFLADGNGAIVGAYDKTFLLAFGEYLPLGETFPKLYEWSPNSGHFSAGTHVQTLPLRIDPEHTYRIGTLICYEDIVSGFVRRAVAESNPHVLINITNDTWFGNTQEPWVHLALAKFRAIEHRRFLVRATNSGVSVIVDSLGRNTVTSHVFNAENIEGEVAMMDGFESLYLRFGAWPGWLSLFILVATYLTKRNRSQGAL